MTGDLPYMSYMALYIISMHVIHTNSRTSTHWKLNLESGKVQSAVAASGESLDGDGGYPDDPLMSILTSKVSLGNGGWKLEAEPSCQEDCQRIPKGESDHSKEKTENSTKSDTAKEKKKSTNSTSSASHSTTTKREKKKSVLDCGKSVNYTQFDHLRGIANRKNHPHVPEPEVAMIFKKKGSRSGEVDLSKLERDLRRLKKEKPKSPSVYNEIGNFWRIKGDTYMSIECFRTALSISPNNPDVLLNLARVLFNLQCLEDAIVLTKRSMDVQTSDQNSWQQYFTLGEIFKAYGHYHEAAVNFRSTLELKPGFQPALAHLREMEINPDGTVTYYTLFIILFLVLGVLCGILTSIDGNFEELGDTMKTQRHFNRAMAMKSIRLGINHKVIRMRKQYTC